MKQNKSIMLEKMSHQAMYALQRFDAQQELLKSELLVNIHSVLSNEARPHRFKSAYARFSPFSSSWLPGPLSYPWLVMLTGAFYLISHLNALI
jgi:hypothetical protein